MTWRGRAGLIALGLVVLVIAGVLIKYREYYPYYPYLGWVKAAFPTQAAEMNEITLPPGFRIGVYSAEVPAARQMALGPNGIVFAGSMGAGKVYALAPGDGGQRAGKAYVIASGLTMPSGIAYRDGALYVAAINRILKFPDVARDLEHPPRPELVTDAYPSDTYHGWKFIAFGPDGRLYVPVGAPCNVCEVSGLHGTITRLDLGGGKPEIVARGVRNSVGFDFHPQTRELWFTDNGRDLWGDDRPPDELNRLAKEGAHFGFPFCHGDGLADDKYNAGKSCRDYTAPARLLGPHVAAIGMRFYTGQMFPEKYRNSIFIAEHGSWNRTTPIGYRVSFVKIDNDKATSYEPFASGWLKGGTASGRPADVLVMPDGALLVSDDKAGQIYRISYEGAR